MSKKKPILIVAGEPFSIFSEVLFKAFKKHKIKHPLVVIGSYKLFLSQMKFLKYKIPLNNIKENFNINHVNINKLNIIDVELNFLKPFQKISNISNLYNEKCFRLALKLLKKNIFIGLINGPISKKHFLKKKFFGITEYLAKKQIPRNLLCLYITKNYL